jgi:tetratricopeptide (TPR) repeat protein
MSSRKKTKHVQVAEAQSAPVKTNVHVWIILALCLSVFLAYTPVFNSDFVNWDDEDYVLNNESIHSFSNLREILTKPIQGNYHPLTMLSLALNYSISGTDATSYHIMNLLLHMMNTVLVFFFVLSLFKGKTWMAFIVALLFGIHPLHVESVAWVSERKDLLYSLFFILGLTLYSKYIDSGKRYFLLIVFLCFILSLLSKPAAVIFPVLLFAIDYFKGRPNILKTYLEKVPFLICSVLFGLLTMQGQESAGATEFAKVFSLTDRFLFASYGIMMYFIKTILPIDLCTFYPFPDTANGLPVIYYLSLVFLLLVLVLFIKTFKTNKFIAFAILFYLLNLALVLQLIPVGNAVIADRYAYLPLIGIFLIPGYYFQKQIDSNKGQINVSMLFALIIVSFTLIRMSNVQAATWKNGASLWDHAIKVSPSSRAYVNRGLLYKQAGNMTKAFESYDHAIKLGSREPDAWVNRGNIYFANREYEKAIQDYNYCLQLNSKQVKAYENRGSSYASLGKTELALHDFNKALELDSASSGAYANRAMLNMSLGEYQHAINDYRKALDLKQDPNGEMWSFSGEAYFKLGKYEAALNCYDQALKIRQTGLYHLNRSLILRQLNRIDEAKVAVHNAQALGMAVDPAYIELLNKLK